MLKSFFIWGFVVFPLGIALIWSLYRARFFLLGLVGIALAISLIWGALRLGDRLDQPPAREETRATPIACTVPYPRAGTGPVPCRF